MTLKGQLQKAAAPTLAQVKCDNIGGIHFQFALRSAHAKSASFHATWRIVIPLQPFTADTIPGHGQSSGRLLTCANSRWRGILRGAAIALALTVVSLSAGCAQSPMAPPSPTATYIPQPTSTAVPTATTVSENDSLQSLPGSEVSISGSTVVFNGIMDQPSYDYFRRTVAASDADIKTIQVRSSGGEAGLGIEMGEWIHARGLDVVVDDYCFSSCANYIFTAGRNKVIRDDSIVAWHGSNLTSEYMAYDQGITLDEQLKQEFDASMEDAPINVESPAHYQMLLNQHKRYSLKQIDEERKFLEKTGVNPEIMTYGFLSEQHDALHTADNRHYQLWTFLIEDMERFGVSNVSYEGDGEYPSDLTLERYPDIVVISVPE